MSTHAVTRTGTGGTTARATTQIGNDITLPAGGPFIIHGIYGQVAKVSTVPNEGTGGELIIDAASGDLVPDPAPGRYPLIGSAISESANSAISAVPLQIWKTNLTAPGKAVIQLSYRNQLAITTGSIVAAGILFGETIPEEKPLIFCDSVQASFASASEQSVGTITLAEKATRIVGIMADCNKGDAATAGEAIMVTVRLASNSITMPPLTLPCNRAFNASDGTAVGQSATPMSSFIPVDIPIVGGAIIDVFALSTVSVTGNVDVAVYIAYE